MNIRYLVSKLSVASFLFALIIFHPKISDAGRYFDQSTIANYSIPASTSGDTFYVDGKNGLDTNDGLSEITAFKTLSKAFDRYRSNKIMGGDVVKIKAGIYRETLSLNLLADQTASLSTSTPLKIGPFGDGEVIVDASSTPSNWTAYNANIFVADWTQGSYPPWAVVLNDNFKACRDKQTLDQLTSYGLWYYDSTNKKIYIHTNGVNPSLLDPVVTYYNTSAENYAIKLNGASHIYIYGITLRGAARYGLTDYASVYGEDIIIQNCTIKHNNGTGIRLFSSNSKLVKNHIYGNMLYNWPRGRIYGADGGWGQGGTISNYGLASGNIVHDNGGEGLGVYGGNGHTTFEDNISYDNYSVGLYLDNAPYCIFRRNLIYSHEPDPVEMAESWQLPKWIQDGGASVIEANLNKILARMRQEGIMTGDEQATNPIAQSVGHQIYNNIIIGARRAYLHYNNATGSGLRNFLIANNTIILPSTVGSYGSYAGMIIGNNGGNNVGTRIENNIIFSPTTEPLMVMKDGAKTSGIELDHNLYYAPNFTAPFKIGTYPSESDLNFTNWKSSIFSGGDTNSNYSNPLFSGSAGEFSSSAYSLDDNSPALGKGANINEFSDDFNYKSRGLLWDVGAICKVSLIAPNNLREENN